MKKLDWSKAEQNRFAKGKKKPVSIRMNVEVLQWLRDESQRQGLRGYQTLANNILEDAMRGSRAGDIDKRLERIERALFKKRA